MVAGLAVAGGIYWIARPAPQNQFAGRFANGIPMSVGVAKVEKGDIRVTLNALGTVTPLASVTVKTQVNGQLQQIAFQEGQAVNRGDFLAQIDPRPYQASLDQVQGTLARDQALLKNAMVDLERYRSLLKLDSIAKQQLDTQEALVRQLEGTIATDQGLVESARVNLAYTHIVAPVTGRVGLRQVDQGNNVSISDPNGIVVINQVKPITVIFPVPEDNLPAIMKRIRDGATLEVTALDRGNKVKLATGKLTTVDNTIDPTTGTVKLRAQFDNTDESLFPNQFVNIQLLVDTLQDKAIVPTSAIQTGAPGTFVYLVNPESTVAVRPVKLGAIEGVRQVVESGLSPGDTVVTEGVDRLRDGAAIILPGAAPPGGPGGGRRGGPGGGPPGGSRPNGERGPGGGSGRPPGGPS